MGVGLPCSITLAVLGVLGIIAGACTLGLFSKLFDSILASQLSLSVGFSFELWQRLPDTVPLMMYLYFYNVTNWQEIQEKRNGTKPQLVEVGPYVYRQYQEMDNLWLNANHSITYFQNKTWIFQEDLSGDRSLDDVITCINPIAIGAASTAKWMDVFNFAMVNNLFNVVGGKLFLQETVRNLTFEGVVDEIMAATMELPGAKDIVPFDKFGWFYTRNNSLTFDGRYNMYTGTDDFKKVGQIHTWNDDTKVPEKMYTGHCGMLNGSAGEFFPAHRDKTYVDLFSSDMCRSLRFTFSEEVDVKGVTGYRYVLGQDLVNNDLPENSCFNPYPDPDIKKVPNGLFNVSSCKYDSPAYVSYPHFLHGDPMLINQFANGTFHPTRKQHESYITLEPLTGVPLEVAIKLQINMLTKPVSVPYEGYEAQIDLLAGLDEIYYPMIWFETVTSLDDSMVGMMSALSKSPSISLGVGIGAICVGLLFCALSAFFIVRHDRMKKFA